MCVNLWDILLVRQNGVGIKRCATLFTVKHRDGIDLFRTMNIDIQSWHYITSRKLTKVNVGSLLTHHNSGFSATFSQSVAPVWIFSSYAALKRHLRLWQNIYMDFQNWHHSGYHPSTLNIQECITHFSEGLAWCQER